jgi:hypothetical protein
MKTFFFGTLFAIFTGCPIVEARVYVPLGTSGGTAAFQANELRSALGKHISILPNSGEGFKSVKDAQQENSRPDRNERKLVEKSTFHTGCASSQFVSSRPAKQGLKKYSTYSVGEGSREDLLANFVILSVDMGFSVQESGGSQALQTAGFYIHWGGEFGSYALPILIEMITTPLIVPIGPFAALLANCLVYEARGIGHAGGEWATRKLLEVIRPAFLDQDENDMIRKTKDSIDAAIVALQRDTVPF